MGKVKPHLKTRQQTFLQEWRIFRRLTQDQAADLLEIDQSTLSRIENGRTPYDQDFLEKAAFVYGCNPADLLMRNPLKEDAVWSVADNLRKASPELRSQATAVLAALLKKTG